MPSMSSPVITAAATLAAWAHQRRRSWSDEPLAPPAQTRMVPEVPEVPGVPGVPGVPEVPEVLEVLAVQDDVVREPRWSARAFAGGAFRSASAVIDAASRSVAHSVDVASRWMMRAAATVSVVSVVWFIGINRDEVATRWNRLQMALNTLQARAVAFFPRPAEPPRPSGPPEGSGRLNVVSSSGNAQVIVDGTPAGFVPLTIDLPAGPHRVVLESLKGSIERSMKIQAGEIAQLDEAIFPGWLAVTAPVDLTLSEDGRLLQRDERGWAILAPGPHAIHLDNRDLRVHEVRHVVVKPGDTTWLSLIPRTSP
jgi:hypothetical protein